jgi:hypothetical protein
MATNSCDTQKSTLAASPRNRVLRLLGSEGTEGLTDADDIPEPPDAAITQPGDLWILGNHRLLCAAVPRSSTSPGRTGLWRTAICGKNWTVV